MGTVDKQTIKPAKQGGSRRPTTWKPGQSGNPKGRAKKGQTLTDLAIAYLEDIEPGEKVTRKEQFVKSVAVLAKQGNIAAIKLLWDHIDGMPVQKTELSGYIRRDLEDMTDDEIRELYNAKIRKLADK